MKHHLELQHILCALNWAVGRYHQERAISISRQHCLDKQQRKRPRIQESKMPGIQKPKLIRKPPTSSHHHHVPTSGGSPHLILSQPLHHPPPTRIKLHILIHTSTQLPKTEGFILHCNHHQAHPMPFLFVNSFEPRSLNSF